MPEPEPKPLPTREPVALSTEYHKARKQLMLWAGILFIWELVGIDLEKAKEAGGNIGAIVSAIKSPRAVPWTLMILVGYFLFRFTVEWNQSNASRRLMRWAKIDFTAAWIVSLGAFALYIGQSISQVQLADVLTRSIPMSFAAGAAAGIGIVTLAFAILKGPVSTRWTIWSVTGLLPVLLLWGGSLIHRFSTSWGYLLEGFAVGCLIGLWMAVDQRRKPKATNSPS
jgi:hypothetical protein